MRKKKESSNEAVKTRAISMFERIRERVPHWPQAMKDKLNELVRVYGTNDCVSIAGNMGLEVQQV